MAGIAPRVRQVLDLMMDAGYGWLAVEAIELIERGRAYPEDLDQELAAERSQIDKGQGGDQTERLPPSDTSSREFRVSEAGQAELVVDLLISRLSNSIEMNMRSRKLLSQIVDRPIRLATYTDEGIIELDVNAAQEAGRRLADQRIELVNWLLEDQVR
jgi:hypothetical protein